MMLADGVGAGAEQAVDGVLLVLLLLVHHGAVLSAGQAAVLGCHAAAVFWLMSAAGKKIPLTVLTHAGSVAVMQPVHQVEAVERHDPVKADALDKHHLFFLGRIPGKDVCGLHDWGHRKFFNIRQGEGVHHMPEVVAGETVVGSNGKEGLVPLLEPVEISPLKVVRRYNKMIDPQGDGKGGGQVVQEKIPIRGLGRHQGIHHVLAAILIQHLQFSRLVQEAEGRVCPQHIQQGGDIRAHLWEQTGKGVPICVQECFRLFTDGTAVMDQGLKG